MSSIDPTVRRETGFIAAAVVIGSTLMQAVFLIIGKWDYTVLLGNLLGGSLAVLNFFLMGLTVQAATKKDEKAAATSVKFSQSARFFMLVIGAGVGAVAPCFNIIAVLVPLFFPRIAIAFRPLMDKKASR